jgi:hypothetical protein
MCMSKTLSAKTTGNSAQSLAGTGMSEMRKTLGMRIALASAGCWPWTLYPGQAMHRAVSAAHQPVITL